MLLLFASTEISGKGAGIVAQICVADLLCYAGLLPRHEEDAAVDGPQACVCLCFTSSVCKPPNG